MTATLDLRARRQGLSDPRVRDTIGRMTAKELLLRRVMRLSEAEAAHAEIVISRAASGDEPEMVGLPESWRTFEDGTPVPNWVAGLDDVRAGD